MARSVCSAACSHGRMPLRTPLVRALPVLVLLPVTVLTAAPAPAATDCTIKGTSGPDRLVGTAGDDIICGFGGDDVLLGREGDDVLNGFGGRDVIRGGPGDDFDRETPGADVFDGGDGVDLVWYVDRNGVSVSLDDVANDGEPGEQDNIHSDVEQVRGTDRRDVIIGNGGDNLLDGGGLDDVIHGGGGNDRILGGSGYDELFGEAGADVVKGGSSSDALVGGAGADSLDGQGTEDVCDDDPADESVLRCRRDGKAPTLLFGVRLKDRAVAPGQQLTLPMVVAKDSALVDAIEVHVIRSADGAGVSACPPTMTPYSPGYRGAESEWKWKCVLPEDFAPGGYLLRAVAKDRVGNETALGALGPDDAAFVVLGPGPDTTPPTVEVEEAPAGGLAPGERFHLTVHVADPNGVSDLGVTATRQVGDGTWCDEESLHLVDGSAVDGSWRLTCEVPDPARNGEWSLVLRALDGYGNGAAPTGDAPVVTVVGGVDDDSAPLVDQVAVAPTTVAPGGSFTVTAHVTDPSGVEIADAMVSDNPPGPSMCQPMVLKSGSATDGTWKATCTMPADAAAGQRTVQIYVQDSFWLAAYRDGGTFTVS